MKRLAPRPARVVTAGDIDGKIVCYVEELDALLLPELPRRPLALFRMLKRHRFPRGEEKSEISVFEIANRAMSNLVVYLTARRLLSNAGEVLGSDSLDSIHLALENEDGSDLAAVTKTGRVLKGECFNVATSFFPVKRSHAVRKLKKATADIRVLSYNHDAREGGIVKSRLPDGWLELVIDLESELRSLGIADPFGSGSRVTP
ncbi:MAG: hypothetical protein IT452_10520 [Planctomycetia bacterium]|nr:hypothetical protein [Planctomycetia bacterium]